MLDTRTCAYWTKTVTLPPTVLVSMSVTAPYTPHQLMDSRSRARAGSLTPPPLPLPGVDWRRPRLHAVRHASLATSKRRPVIPCMRQAPTCCDVCRSTGALSVPVRVCVGAAFDALAAAGAAAVGFAGVFAGGFCGSVSLAATAVLNWRSALPHVPHSFSPPASLKARRKSPLRRPIVIAFLRFSFMFLVMLTVCKEHRRGGQTSYAFRIQHLPSFCRSWDCWERQAVCQHSRGGRPSHAGCPGGVWEQEQEGRGYSRDTTTHVCAILQ